MAIIYRAGTPPRWRALQGPSRAFWKRFGVKTVTLAMAYRAPPLPEIISQVLSLKPWVGFAYEFSRKASVAPVGGWFGAQQTDGLG